MPTSIHAQFMDSNVLSLIGLQFTAYKRLKTTDNFHRSMNSRSGMLSPNCELLGTIIESNNQIIWHVMIKVL